MPQWEEYAQLLGAIAAEWDLAESDIKRAEQVCDKVVTPSIKELRYAGRRVVEAIQASAKDAPIAQVQELLSDARFDCHRARHDAIDAATAKIAIDLGIMVEKLGHDVIIGAFPQFADFYGKLYTIRDKIVNSRGNRDDRDTIYSIIEEVDFPELCSWHRRLQASEPLMVRIARKRRWERVLLHVFGWAGVAVLAFVILDHLPKSSPSP